MKILIVEDDVKLARLIARGLHLHGYAVDSEHDGANGYETARSGLYDIIILDVMLPEKSGLQVARDLREGGCSTPILVLTARDAPHDVVAGLNAGADDYLRKPFAFEELEARLRTLSRRAQVPPRMILRVENLTYDTTSKYVERNGRPIHLTGRELSYLEYFMRNAGIVVTKRMVENALWDRDTEIGSNVVEVYVGRLRSKLALDGLPPLITTIHGVGYRFGPARPES
jgi:DNA-binding response OmpR family regulator